MSDISENEEYSSRVNTTLFMRNGVRLKARVRETFVVTTFGTWQGGGEVEIFVNESEIDEYVTALRTIAFDIERQQYERAQVKAGKLEAS